MINQLTHTKNKKNKNQHRIDWIEAGRLNQLREHSVAFAETVLQDGDLYYVPRKTIHQFQTVSGCTSVAWHLRYKEYEEFKKGDINGKGDSDDVGSSGIKTES